MNPEEIIQELKTLVNNRNDEVLRKELQNFIEEYRLKIIEDKLRKTEKNVKDIQQQIIIQSFPWGWPGY